VKEILEGNCRGGKVRKNSSDCRGSKQTDVRGHPGGSPMWEVVLGWRVESRVVRLGFHGGGHIRSEKVMEGARGIGCFGGNTGKRRLPKSEKRSGENGHRG